MNWDKPLPLQQITPLGLNAHHGGSFTFEQWKGLIKRSSVTESYETYLTYCKLMSSYLGQALL